MASGSGISGSTAGTAHFGSGNTSRPQGRSGEQPDGDLRELQFKKNQYGPKGETIVVRYSAVCSCPNRACLSLDKVAREATVEDAFIAIGKKLEARGQELSPAQTSHSYAPNHHRQAARGQGHQEGRA